ncbi:MAG: type II toxin-antitoxin system VapC family toxin [Chloroflexi bacterium]|nr:type II toxin-antitoxin system VapC family toxin [Chloroflexota bacterium]
MYLLDTNVLSALRRPDRHPEPAAWLKDQRPSDVYLSVVTVAEIERGIARQMPRDPDFARELSTWMERTLAGFADRLLGVDVPTARRWGRLSATLGHSGADLLIAATALQHGLTVVTRNPRHFHPTGVPLLNRFLPSEDQ